MKVTYFFPPNEIHPEFEYCLDIHAQQQIFYRRKITDTEYMAIAIADRIADDGYIFTVGKTYIADSGEQYTITRIHVRNGLVYICTEQTDDMIAGLLITKLNKPRISSETHIPWGM